MRPVKQVELVSRSEEECDVVDDYDEYMRERLDKMKLTGSQFRHARSAMAQRGGAGGRARETDLGSGDVKGQEVVATVNHVDVPTDHNGPTPQPINDKSGPSGTPPPPTEETTKDTSGSPQPPPPEEPTNNGPSGSSPPPPEEPINNSPSGSSPPPPEEPPIDVLTQQGRDQSVQNMLSSIVYSLGLSELEESMYLSHWHSRTVIPPLDTSTLT